MRWVEGRRGGVEGVGGVLRIPFRHNGTSCLPKEPSMVSKPHYKERQAIQCHLIKAHQALPQSYQSSMYKDIKNPSGKADLAI